MKKFNLLSRAEMKKVMVVFLNQNLLMENWEHLGTVQLKPLVQLGL
jgi:hypothetical protein